MKICSWITWFTTLLMVMTICFGCEKQSSEHLQKALLLMENRTDYTDPIFEDVLNELGMVPDNDPNYEKAQNLITRIERVRGYISETRERDEWERKQKEAELERNRQEHEKRLKEILAGRAGKFKRSDAERALNRKIREMELLEQKLIEEQQKKANVRPTPNPFKFTPRDDRGRNEKYWRARKKRLDQQLSTLISRRDIFKKQIELLNTAGLPRHKILENRNKRNELNSRLAEVNRQVAKAQEQLDKLPDQLRKAGGLPGWIR